MKQPASPREILSRAAHRRKHAVLREQIPLRDMSDSLLAVYDGVSQWAFQRYLVRGTRCGSDLEDWKAAEEDMFARISVDFEESAGSLYALASLPGCAGKEITVAVDECWLLIAGYGDSQLRADADQYASDEPTEDDGAYSSACEDLPASDICGTAESSERCGGDGNESPEDQAAGEPQGSSVRSPRERRPFCVVALRAKVDPLRSVAVLSNGLLAIRMSKVDIRTALLPVA